MQIFRIMLGSLTITEIDDLLKEQVTGRIGCCNEGKTYIVPINYVYQDGVIYGHSAAGKKIDMLRINPQVCFQVDVIKNITDWKSAIVWGKFQEITEGEEMRQAMQAIIKHVMPAIESEDSHPSHGFTESESDIGTSIDLILYKISIDEKTGRFERPSQI